MICRIQENVYIYITVVVIKCLENTKNLFVYRKIFYDKTVIIQSIIIQRDLRMEKFY